MGQYCGTEYGTWESPERRLPEVVPVYHRREQVRYASWETPTIVQSSFFFRIMNWDDIVQLSGLVTLSNRWRRRKPRLKASGNCLIIFKGKMRKVTSLCLQHAWYLCRLVGDSTFTVLTTCIQTRVTCKIEQMEVTGFLLTY